MDCFVAIAPRNDEIDQRVGWVERSDTHHVLNGGDGFRAGLNPSYGSVNFARWAEVCSFGPSRIDERRNFFRHCEPTGRANARPMTGSAKRSTSPQTSMDCFVASLLAMT